VSFGNAAWLLLALPVLALWLMQWRGRLRWLSLALLLVLALADPKLDALRAAGGNLVLLVDRSASVQGEAERRARSLAPELERRAQSEHAGLYIVGFGRGAAMLARPGEAFEPANSAQDDSDLLAGLQLAAAQPDVSEIVLVSDGVYTTDDPTPLALQLRQQGTRIHSLRVGERPAADAAITRILAPQRVPRGQPFAVAIEVDSPQPQAARLRLRDQHGQVVYDEALQLEPGARRYALRLDASDPGVHALDAELEVAGDTRPGNNRARSVVEVVGAQQRRPRLGRARARRSAEPARARRCAGRSAREHAAERARRRGRRSALRLRAQARRWPLDHRRQSQLRRGWLLPQQARAAAPGLDGSQG
jgi:hypothetical protein